jgi:hypothetical protein
MALFRDSSSPDWTMASYIWRLLPSGYDQAKLGLRIGVPECVTIGYPVCRIFLCRTILVRLSFLLFLHLSLSFPFDLPISFL